MIVRASEMQRSACSMDQKRQTNALLFWLWWDSSPNMGILLNSPEREKIRSSRRRVVARVDEIIKPYDSSRHFHYNFQDGQQRRSAQYKGIFWVQIIKLLLSERALNTKLWDILFDLLWYMGYGISVKWLPSKLIFEGPSQYQFKLVQLLANLH